MAGTKDMAAESMQSQLTGKLTTSREKNKSETLIKLEKSLTDIVSISPKHLTEKRIFKVVQATLTRNPILLDCSPTSIILAVKDSCQLGLEPDGPLQQSHLIPFKNGKTKKMEATFIVGYRGYIDLAYRSGQLANIHPDVVYEGDLFEYEFGSNGHLKHIYGDNHGVGKPKFFYCYTKLINGGEAYTVLNLRDVNRAREMSKAKDSGPWINNFSAMGRKTAIRRHSILMPMSVELLEAIDHDNKVEYGEDFANVTTAEAEIVTDEKPTKPKPTKPAANKTEKPAEYPTPKQSTPITDLEAAQNEYSISCEGLLQTAGKEYTNKLLFSLFPNQQSLLGATLEQLQLAKKTVDDEIERIHKAGENK